MKRYSSANPVSDLPAIYAAWASRGRDYPALVCADATLGFGDLADALAGAAGACAPGTRLVETDAPAARWLAELLAIIGSGGRAIMADPDWTPSVRDAALARVPAAARRPEGPGIWLFTSGTTAEPQPHFRSMRVLGRMVGSVRSVMPPPLLQGRPCAMALAPLHHGFGLVNALFLVHALGGTVVVAEPGGHRALAERVRFHRPRLLYAWPGQLAALSDEAGQALRKSGLQWCVCSSASLTPAAAEHFRQTTGCMPRQQYGTTEDGPLCLDSDPQPLASPGCVGPALPGAGLRIAGPDGEPLAPGAPGMVMARGIGRRAWRQTGDIGRLDRQGRLHLLGRATPLHDERRDMRLSA